MEILAFCVMRFEPIKIQTRLAPQNDRLNLSFVKDENTVGEKKWPEMILNGHYLSCPIHFRSEFKIEIRMCHPAQCRG